MLRKSITVCVNIVRVTIDAVLERFVPVFRTIRPCIVCDELFIPDLDKDRCNFCVKHIPLCLSCEKPFIPNLDKDLCDSCINEAYEHEPNLYAKVIWPGNGSVTVSLRDAPETIKDLMAGLSEGDTFNVEMIGMSAAEYKKLPDFGGW